MDWRRFLASALAFTAVSFIGLFTLLICQGALPWNPERFPGLALDTAFNMTASFVTNTNWQPIAGETNLSYFSQAVGLAVQNFLSPAVGIAVAFALLRGLASSDGGKLGNFFVDVVRAVLYVLLPLSLVLALVGVWQGSPQTFQGYEMVQLLEPVSVDAEGALVDADDPTAVQEVTEAVVPLGPQSSQVAIKQLGTNGGGFNGANSASALENPTPLTNLLQCAAMPLIPFALIFAFGRMVGDRRQSRALMTVVLAILAAGLFSVIAAETAATPQLSADGAVYLGALDQSAGNMEGKECRIGVGESAAWTALTSATSNGSANASIEAMTPIGTLVPLALIGLGEVVGGGVGIKICDPSVVCDEDVVALMESCCEKEQIKYQREVIDKGGTDASSMNLSGVGVRTGGVVVVTRYPHSQSAVASKEDIDGGVDLLNTFCKSELTFC